MTFADQFTGDIALHQMQVIRDDGVHRQVCAAADDSEHHAWVALWEFEHDRFRFQDWERDCKVWTHRFLWCCYALEWAIDTYDAQKAGAPAVAT